MPTPQVRRHAYVTPPVVAASSGVNTDQATLGDLTYDELYALAQANDVSGRSAMTKDELIQALS